MSEEVSRVVNGGIAQISQKVNHFTFDTKFSPLLLSSIIPQILKKVKYSLKGGDKFSPPPSI